MVNLFKDSIPIVEQDCDQQIPSLRQRPAPDLQPVQQIV